MNMPPKKIHAWAGLSEEKVHTTNEEWTHEEVYAIYTSRSAARRCYERVVPVEIRFIEKKK